jgi:hypothetical protein
MTAPPALREHVTQLDSETGDDLVDGAPGVAEEQDASVAAFADGQ